MSSRRTEMQAALAQEINLILRGQEQCITLRFWKVQRHKVSESDTYRVMVHTGFVGIQEDLRTLAAPLLLSTFLARSSNSSIYSLQLVADAPMQNVCLGEPAI